MHTEEKYLLGGTLSTWYSHSNYQYYGQLFAALLSSYYPSEIVASTAFREIRRFFHLFAKFGLV